MNPEEQSWHINQAAELQRSEAMVQVGHASIVVSRGMIGMRLNRVYGPAIPFPDLEQLVDIYGWKQPAIQQIRRFGAALEERGATPEQVAREYSTWTEVVRGYLSGLSPAKTKELIGATDRQTAGRRAVANVGRTKRQELVERFGMFEDDADQAVQFWLFHTQAREIVATWEGREQLRDWAEFQNR